MFAIGNTVLQLLLKPFHDWYMTALKTIRMDGTFHQGRPLRYLRGKMRVFSYDLSAATDRFPVRALFPVAEALWGPELASASVNTALAGSIFEVPFKFSKSRKRKRSSEVVSLTVGQPLGYYSSWPLFSLAHHVLVWIAAETEYPGRLFRDYAILGDDICIADESVAERYRTLIQMLGVKIS